MFTFNFVMDATNQLCFPCHYIRESVFPLASQGSAGYNLYYKKVKDTRFFHITILHLICQTLCNVSHVCQAYHTHIFYSRYSITGTTSNHNALCALYIIMMVVIHFCMVFDSTGCELVDTSCACFTGCQNKHFF